MPRSPRLDLANVPQHVIQRGNDRQPCFFREIDYIRYLQDLREAALKYGCQIHAYVLMTNHVHLLVTPREAGAVSRMMQSVGRRYVRFINDTLARTGTLWEGRYKSSLVDSEHYLLACYRYIELNPVRAAMVALPDEYRWSSYACNGQGSVDLLITPHPVYREINPDAESRRAHYRALVAQGIGDDELATIRAYAQEKRDTHFSTSPATQLGARACRRDSGTVGVPDSGRFGFGFGFGFGLDHVQRRNALQRVGRHGGEAGHLREAGHSLFD